MSRILLDMNYYLEAKQNGVIVPNFFENIHSMLDSMAIKKGIDLETYSANRGAKGMTSINHDFDTLNKLWNEKLANIQKLSNSNNSVNQDSFNQEQYSKVHH